MKRSSIVLAGLLFAAPVMAESPARPANLDQTGEQSREPVLDTGNIVGSLRSEFGARLAGMYFTATDKEIVVRLTGNGKVVPRTYEVGGEKVSVVFEEGAVQTFTELNSIMVNNDSVINEMMPGAHGRYVDERTGEVVVLVVPQQAECARKNIPKLVKKIGAPVRVEPANRAMQQPALKQD